MSTIVPLRSTMSHDGPSIYYTPAFRVMLEAHIPYFKQGRRSSYVSIDPSVAYKYEYDFYALLTSLKIPKYHQWFVMRLNGMTSPEQFRAEKLGLYIPDFEILDRLRTNHATLARTV